MGDLVQCIAGAGNSGQDPRTPSGSGSNPLEERTTVIFVALQATVQWTPGFIAIVRREGIP